MIGIAKLRRTVAGRAKADVPSKSTIPRDLAAMKAASAETTPAAPEDSPGDTRAADRFVPHRTSTVLTTAGGKRLAGRIINISRNGVAVEAEFKEFGADEIVAVGTRPVLPGRRITLGHVFLFRKQLDPKLCDVTIVL